MNLRVAVGLLCHLLRFEGEQNLLGLTQQLVRIAPVDKMPNSTSKLTSGLLVAFTAVLP